MVWNKDLISQSLSQLSVTMKPGPVNRSVVRNFGEGSLKELTQQAEALFPSCCLECGLDDWYHSSHCVCRGVGTTI